MVIFEVCLMNPVKFYLVRCIIGHATFLCPTETLWDQNIKGRLSRMPILSFNLGHRNIAERV